MASGSGSDDAGSPRIGSRRRASPPVPPDEDALSGSTSSSSSSAGSDDERESDEPATRTKRSRTVSSRLGSAQRPGLLQELAPQAQAAERIPSRADLRARHALLDPVRQLVDKDAPPISRAAQRLRAPVQVALATTPDVVKLQEAERKWLCKERAWLMRTMVKGNPSSQQEEEQFWEDVMVARAADGPTSGRTRRRRKRDRAKEKAWDSRAVQWARQQYDEFVEARPPDFLEPRNETWFQAPVEVSSVVDLKVKGQSLPDRLLKAATAGSARSGKAWDVATDKVRKFAVARMQGGSIGPVSLRRSGRDHHRQDTADSTALSLWLSGMSDSRGTSFDLAGLDQQNMDGDDVDRHRLVEAPEEALDEFDRLHSETGMAASSARSRGKARAGENLVVPAVILEGHELGPDLGDEGTPSGGVSPARSRLSLATSSPTSVATSRAPSPVLLGQGETVESPSALDDDPFRRFEFPPRIHPPSPDPSTKSAPLPDARSLMANGSNASSLLPNGSPRASPSGSPRARHRYLLPSLDFGSLGTSSPSEGARDGHCVRDSRDEGSLRSGYSTPGRPADDEARSPTSNLASPIWRATRFADDSILTLAHLDDSAKRRHGLHLRHHRAHRKHRAGGDDDQRASRTSLLSDARTAVTGRTVRKGPRGSMGDYVPGWRGRKPDGPRATKLRTLNAEKEALAAAELAEMLAEVAQEDEQQQDLRETEKLYQRQAGLVLFGRTHFASRIATVRWQTIKRIKDRTSRDWDALYTSADIRPKLVESPYDITSFPLPTDDWHWISDWSVDMRHDVDADGWEYFDFLTWRWRGDRMSLRNFSRRRAFVRTRARAPLKLAGRKDPGEEAPQPRIDVSEDHGGLSGPVLGLDSDSHATFQDMLLRRKQVFGPDPDPRDPFIPLRWLLGELDAGEDTTSGVDGDRPGWREALAHENLKRVSSVFREISTDREKLMLWRHYLLQTPVALESAHLWPRPERTDVVAVLEHHLQSVLRLFMFERSRVAFLNMLNTRVLDTQAPSVLRQPQTTPTTTAAAALPVHAQDSTGFWAQTVQRLTPDKAPPSTDVTRDLEMLAIEAETARHALPHAHSRHHHHWRHKSHGSSNLADKDLGKAVDFAAPPADGSRPRHSFGSLLQIPNSRA